MEMELAPQQELELQLELDPQRAPRLELRSQQDWTPPQLVLPSPATTEKHHALVKYILLLSLYVAGHSGCV